MMYLIQNMLVHATIYILYGVHKSIELKQVHYTLYSIQGVPIATLNYNSYIIHYTLNKVYI